MDIPAFAILIVYGAVLLVVIVFSFFNVYHVLRFGMHTTAAYSMSAIYVVVVALIVIGTWLTLGGVDWGGSFTVELPDISLDFGTR
ncbi:MAG: hypothetical protein HY420_03380 [Candidatus Kerfeldbacteria bacterium]|nr:hypothetical protein [Candidatus Kerfeldbacteria bacterium]